MTLAEFCAVLSNTARIVVIQSTTTVADFYSDTYESIIDTYGDATITGITINVNTSNIKNITITIS